MKKSYYIIFKKFHLKKVSGYYIYDWNINLYKDKLEY
jgi:hypothetical protein